MQTLIVKQSNIFTMRIKAVIMKALNEDRREFLKNSGLVAAGLMFFPGCSIKDDDPTYHFFTQEEAKTLISFCEQLIPADELYGGATDACVIYYIDRQLLGPLKKHTKSYKEDIVKLNAYCQQQLGNAFAELSDSDQIKVMRRMEKNKIDKSIWKNPSAFFKTVHAHTMQGFYGSPAHGGNKGHMSFDMLEIEALLRMRLEYPVTGV